MQEALKPLANLLMSEIFGPIKGFLAAPYGVDEAGFFLEIARENFPRQFLGFTALPCSGVSYSRFKFRPEVRFHRSAPALMVRH